MQILKCLGKLSPLFSTQKNYLDLNPITQYPHISKFKAKRCVFKRLYPGKILTKAIEKRFAKCFFDCFNQPYLEPKYIQVQESVSL